MRGEILIRTADLCIIGKGSAVRRGNHHGG
jgi:hypothetical protein